MLYHWLANLVAVVHLTFVLFVVLGVLLVGRWPRLSLFHIPALIWGVLIELAGWICPLTPLENYLRRLAGEAGYAGGFIEHYVTALVYPSGLSRDTQIVLGLSLLALNLACYWRLILRWRRPSHGK